MSYAIFASHEAAEHTGAPRQYVPIAAEAGASKPLAFFQGLALAVPLGAGCWVALYWLVRALA